MPSLALIRNLAEIEISGDSFSMSGEGIKKWVLTHTGIGTFEHGEGPKITPIDF
jgi:hypothetical protein